jgi:hypothetical protein
MRRATSSQHDRPDPRVLQNSHSLLLRGLANKWAPRGSYLLGLAVERPRGKAGQKPHTELFLPTKHLPIDELLPADARPAARKGASSSPPQSQFIESDVGRPARSTRLVSSTRDRSPTAGAESRRSHSKLFDPSPHQLSGRGHSAVSFPRTCTPKPRQNAARTASTRLDYCMCTSDAVP